MNPDKFNVIIELTNTKVMGSFFMLSNNIFRELGKEPSLFQWGDEFFALPYVNDEPLYMIELSR